MADKYRVLIDLNIILDALQKRQPYYEFSARLLANAENNTIEGLISAHSVTTLFYLIAKDSSADLARGVLTQLLSFLKVASVTQETIEQALMLPYRDFEDAVQIIAALQSRADYLVTRNPQDYKPPIIPVLQPVELLALLS
jgi:predicted nucleic acid-binding protein